METKLDQCYKALGFRQPPFGISPDASLFYPNGQHVSAYNELRFAMQGAVIAVLTGEVGLGKSLIFRCLMNNFQDNVRSALLPTPLLTYPEILACIYKDFTGNPAPVDASLGEIQVLLQEYATNQASLGQHLVVMVDEAQKLSAEALEGLRLLSNLETDQRKLISLVLAGQPELEQTLSLRAMRPLRERIGVWCRLKPLSRAECGSYIRHRVARTQERGDLRFSNSAILLIYQLTKGVPRRINLLCDRVLLLAFATDRNRITWPMIMRAAHDLAPGRTA